MAEIIFEFPDAYEFAARLAQAPELVKSEMTKAVDRVVIYGLSVTVPATPVRTGHLRRSNIKRPSVWTGTGAIGGWENATPYGRYVEYGTYKMDARPFMEPGAEAAEKRLEPEFDAAIKRIVQGLGG